MRFLLLAFLSAAAAAQPITLQLLLPQGGARTFYVETATTAAERRQGLSGRQTLAADGGMLFDFRPPRPRVCMWMKDTHLPLAALFADERMQIVTIAAMAPHTTNTHCSDSSTPIRYVLEIHQQQADGILVGSHLRLVLPQY